MATDEAQPHKIGQAETSSFIWAGIEISLTHTPSWLNSDHRHIELRAGERLPVTQTGYRSHFVHQDEFALFDGPEDFARQWLEQAATSKEWQKYLKDSQQLTLF